MSASSVNIAVSAVRFLYAVTLGRETLDLMASVSDMKRATGRADSEVEAIYSPVEERIELRRRQPLDRLPRRPYFQHGRLGAL